MTPRAWLEKQFEKYSTYLKKWVEDKVGSGGSSLPEPPNDGSVWAWSQGEWVRICPEGHNVQVEPTTSGASLKAGVAPKVIDIKAEDSSEKGESNG